VKIIYVSTRIPYPPTTGDRLLIYNRAVKMSRNNSLDLVAFYQREEELQYLENIRHLFGKVFTIKVSRLAGFTNILGNYFFCNDPFQVMFFNSRSIRARIKKIVMMGDYDLVDAYLIRTVPLVNITGTPVVLDLIDSMQLNFLNRIDKATNWAKLWFYKLEYARLVKYERAFHEGIKDIVFVSERDCASLKARSKVIPLGVSTDEFYPSKLKKNQIIFSGNMSYEPNIQAVMWFVINCFDSIKAVNQDVVLIVAGRDPSLTIRNLASDRIIITGYVDSIADLVSESMVAIVPMTSGSGMQNKLLEAMSCGVTVVATSYGIGDVKVTNMKEVLISDSALGFSAHVINVLSNPKKYSEIACNGRDFVINNHSWDTHVESLSKVYQNVLKLNDNL